MNMFEWKMAMIINFVDWLRASYFQKIKSVNQYGHKVELRDNYFLRQTKHWQNLVEPIATPFDSHDYFLIDS